MNLKKTAYLTLLAAAASGLVACDDFLDVDPSKSTQKTIETAEQLDALLGSYSRFYSEYNHTALACDDFGLTTDIHDYQNGGMSPSNLEYILWSDQGTGTSRLLWDGEYSKIYYANLVLAYIDEVSGDAETKANLKAEAHFLRAYSMFQLAVAYTLYYDGSNGSELGLPLKQTISFEEGIARASLADTWSFIDNDLQEALKITTPLVEQGKRRVWRGTTAAVHAFAARYYLYRGDLDNAKAQVEAVLAEYNTLKDFNTSMSYSANDDEYEINASTNKEIVTVKYPYTKLQFYGTNGYPELFEWEDLLFARTCSYASWWYIPSEDLLATYEADVPGGDPMNDLRYEYFVVEDFSLRYCQTDPAFRYPGYCQFYFDNLISGPTVAEMLLIKAEVQARQGDWQGAMQTLVPLRKARIKAEAYTELTASSQADALQKILRERRRELAFVSRWYDMKRLNANDDPADDITVTREFYPYTTSSVLDPPRPTRSNPGRATTRSRFRRWTSTARRVNLNRIPIDTKQDETTDHTARMRTPGRMRIRRAQCGGEGRAQGTLRRGKPRLRVLPPEENTRGARGIGEGTHGGVRGVSPRTVRLGGRHRGLGIQTRAVGGLRRDGVRRQDPGRKACRA